MNVKVSVFVICVETIIYLLLYNLHDRTFKLTMITYKEKFHDLQILSDCKKTRFR